MSSSTSSRRGQRPRSSRGRNLQQRERGKGSRKPPQRQLLPLSRPLTPTRLCFKRLAKATRSQVRHSGPSSTTSISTPDPRTSSSVIQARSLLPKARTPVLAPTPSFPRMTTSHRSVHSPTTTTSSGISNTRLADPTPSPPSIPSRPTSSIPLSSRLPSSRLTLLRPFHNSRSLPSLPPALRDRSTQPPSHLPSLARPPERRPRPRPPSHLHQTKDPILLVRARRRRIARIYEPARRGPSIL